MCPHPGGPATAADGTVPALTGLRALAIAAVVALHANLPFARGGGLGVDMFFVLSGYLITSILLRELERDARIDYRAFLARRGRRLMPALVFMLAVVAVFAAIAPISLTPDARYPQIGDSLIYAGTYITDIAVLHGAPGGPLTHTWSLGVEMQFYVLWPLVLMAAYALGARLRTLIGLSLALIVVTEIWRLHLQAAGDVNHIIYSPDTRADELLAGAVVAMLQRGRWLPVQLMARLAPIALAVLAALVVHQLSPTQLADGGYVLIYLSAAILVAHLATREPTAFLRPLKHPLVVYIGLLSYSIYLWHVPVFHMLTAQGLGLSRTSSIVLRLTVTLALAAFSYHFIEPWLRRPRPRSTRRSASFTPWSLPSASSRSSSR